MPFSSGVDINRLQVPVGAGIHLGIRPGPAHVRVSVQVYRLVERAVVKTNRLAAFDDFAVPDPFPGDGGRRLDLLDHRPTRGAGHEEQKQGVGAGHGRFAQQDPGRLFFTVGVGDVQAHPPGAGGSDFYITADSGLHQSLVQDLDVTDQLGRVQGTEVSLQGSPEGFDAVSLVQVVQHFRGRAKNILVGQSGGGVDTVHHQVRFFFRENLVEEGSVQDFFGERKEGIVDDRPPMPGIVQHLLAAGVLEGRADEQVPVDTGEFRSRIREVLLEQAGCFGHLRGSQ